MTMRDPRIDDDYYGEPVEPFYPRADDGSGIRACFFCNVEMGERHQDACPTYGHEPTSDKAGYDG